MKRASIAAGAVVFAFVAVGVFGQLRRAHRESVQQAATERFLAAHPLEVTAASIDAARRKGQVAHFAIMPRDMPPGLVRMDPSGPLADDGVTDVYSYEGFKVAVNFTYISDGKPCADQPCIRDTDLTVATDDAPSLRHVAVWFIGGPPSTATEARRFWAKTTWVPHADATWFTDLATQGTIYTRR